MKPSNASTKKRPGSCTLCRHRKIRCDGMTPICGQCIVIPGGREDCEYRDESGAKTNTEILEESIARLERRIQELETIDDPPPNDAVLLTRPYSNKAIPVDVRRNPSPGELVASLRTFVENCGHLAFFLHPGRFRDNAIQCTKGNNALPPALLNAACLWGSRMAPQPQHHLEEYFLYRTEQHLAGDLHRSDPIHVLMSIQVELLLALYFVDIGRSLRGSYHANGAVSLAHGARLSAAGSNNGVSDPIEQAERIHAFWMCLVVSNHFVTAGAPFHCPSPMLNEVTTPWPLPFARYTVIQQWPQEPVVKAYLQGYLDSESCSEILLAKSSILYEFSTTLLRKEQSEGSSSSFQSCIKALDNHISNLLAIFPCSPSVIAQSPDLTLAQALIGVAIIRRFNRFAQRDSKSRDRCFRAAFEVAATVREAVREGAWKIINPMIWPLYALCAGILGTYRSSDGDLGGRSAQDWQEALQVMLALFSRFSDRRPLGVYIAQIGGQEV